MMHSNILNNKLKQDEKGVTIITLVVTIVVLLILAGITINFAFGKNGIITSAKEAEKRMEEGSLVEEQYIKDFGEWINNVTNGNNTTSQDIEVVSSGGVPITAEY